MTDESPEEKARRYCEYADCRPDATGCFFMTCTKKLLPKPLPEGPLHPYSSTPCAECPGPNNNVRLGYIGRFSQ